MHMGSDVVKISGLRTFWNDVGRLPWSTEKKCK